jgi:molecular chaperone DnaJ
MFGMGQNGPRSGRDIQVVVDLTLEEAYRGVSKTVVYQREENCAECAGKGIRKGARPPTCRRCNGSGVEVVRGFFGLPQQQACRNCRGMGVLVSDADICPACRGRARVTAKHTHTIDVPPGVDTRDGMPVAGEGHAGEPGGQNGNLICVFRVAEHKMFRRQGIHLMLADPIPLSFADAAMGTTVEVPTLDGPLEFKIEPGVQSGTRLKFDGKGMPDVNNPRRRGDLLAPIAVVTPRKLNERQRELLKEFAEIEKQNVSPEHKSFIDKVRDFFKGQRRE